jgi:LmbE family N-acetylglucosaminyl deacetylase
MIAPLRTLILVAHPDDEILGAGIWMHRNRDREIFLAHLTGGTPINYSGDRDAYAAARRAELRQALAMLAIPFGRCFSFDLIDQQVHLRLDTLIPDLTRLVVDIKPDLVMTHCYEGGHPDHDSAAFAASRLRFSIPGFELLEFPLYHAVPGTSEAVFSKFLDEEDPCTSSSDTILHLDPPEVELKTRMLNCFSSQRDILSRFSLSSETFRPAPQYDFRHPPHPGPLLYEQWNFGVTWPVWSAHIRSVIEETPPKRPIAGENE